MSVALVLFSTGYSCSKLLALAMLGAVSGEALAAWLAAECVVFLLVRVMVSQWRFFVFLGDSTALSLTIHLGWFLIMLTAPFTFARGPHYLSPSIYAGFIAWTLLCANPIMLALAYNSFAENPKLDWQTSATVLGASTAICVVGAVCALASMPEWFRSTFYKHYTMATYIRNYVWCEQTTLQIDGELVECEREFVQAHVVIGDVARAYWPMDLVEPFARENWCVPPMACPGENLDT